MVGLEIERCSCGSYLIDKFYWQGGVPQYKKECINLFCPYTIIHEYSWDNQTKPYKNTLMGDGLHR